MSDARTEVERLRDANERLKRFVKAAAVGLALLGTLAVVQFIATVIACHELRAVPRAALAAKHMAAQAVSDFKQAEEEIERAQLDEAREALLVRIKVLRLELKLMADDTPAERRVKIEAELANLEAQLQRLASQQQVRGWCGTEKLEKLEMEKADQP